MALIDDLMAGPSSDSAGESEDELIGGSEPQADPVRKEVANYRPADAGAPEACENCENFIAPEGCSRVMGKISASGVCDLFEPAQTEGLLDEGLDQFLFSGGGAI